MHAADMTCLECMSTVTRYMWMADQYVADAPKWGYIDPARWNAFYNWVADEKIIDEKLPENTGFTNDYLA